MDTKVKKRGWIKNAAIIFLAIMLVLTFFSQTILNRSLPEVATQYIQNGTINARIRGTGTVTANYTFDVKIKETRVVKTVAVRTGDRVEEGSVLFILSEEAPVEVGDMEKQLDQLILNYQKMLIDAGGSDYAVQRRAIERAREDLNEAIALRDSKLVTEAQLTAARQAIVNAKASEATWQERVDAVQEELNSLVQVTGPGMDALESAQQAVNSAAKALQDARNVVEQKKNAVNQAKNALIQAEIVHGNNYKEIEKNAWRLYKNDASDPAINMPWPSEQTRINFMAAQADIFSDSADPVAKSQYAAYTAIESCKTAIKTAEDAVRVAELAVTEASTAYNNALAAYNKLYTEITNSQSAANQYAQKKAQLEAQLKSNQKQLADAQAAVLAAENALMELNTKKSEYEAAVVTVKACQLTLDNALFDLTETQKNDEKSDQRTQLDLANAYKEITDLREKIEKMKTGSVSTEVLSQVAGIVKSINITAGNTTEYDKALAVIEVTDRGYSLTFPVTLEQAKKVQVGDQAELSNYWWGPQIKATLINILPDKDKPNESRLLMFNIEGECNTGDQFTLSIGQRSANFDMVVPNSAIRTDANGTFVLIIVAKNSPLGNRYIATRADVNILAQDDTNTAISGAVVSWDNVITTSSVPVEPGAQVRIAGSR